MFQPNETLLLQYAVTHPQSQETLVDFGIAPASQSERTLWENEVHRFLIVLTSRGYRFQPAISDGIVGLCPFYTILLDKGDFQGPTPVELPYFQWVVNQLCLPQQSTVIHKQILEIHVLGNE